MYCKHCGKQIADDSTFCQHCGGKVIEVSSSEVNSGVSQANNEQSESAQEVVVATKEANPIQVEISKKGKDNSSTIANEIVGNLKMVGISAALFAVYMIGFMLIHQKDITQYDYDTNTSYYGESCYDPSTLTGNWKFHWEQHYYDLLYSRIYNQAPVYAFEQLTAKECLKEAEKLEVILRNMQKDINIQCKKQPRHDPTILTHVELKASLLNDIKPIEIKKEAKEAATRDVEEWNNTINNHRRWGYEKDLKKNAFYAAIISLLTMVLGRYLVKSVKWINANKTT